MVGSVVGFSEGSSVEVGTSEGSTEEDGYSVGGCVSHSVG